MVLRLVDAGKSYTEVSHLTGVGRASVSRWMRRYKATGSLEAKPIGGGQVSLITEEQLLVLVQLAQDHTNYTDAELTQAFVEQTKVQVSVRSVRRALERIRFSRKKARTASERSRPDVVARRAYTRTKIMPVLPVERTFS